MDWDEKRETGTEMEKAAKGVARGVASGVASGVARGVAGGVARGVARGVAEVVLGVSCAGFGQTRGGVAETSYATTF